MAQSTLTQRNRNFKSVLIFIMFTILLFFLGWKAFIKSESVLDSPTKRIMTFNLNRNAEVFAATEFVNEGNTDDFTMFQYKYKNQTGRSFEDVRKYISSTRIQ